MVKGELILPPIVADVARNGVFTYEQKGRMLGELHRGTLGKGTFDFQIDVASGGTGGAAPAGVDSLVESVVDKHIRERGL